MRSHADRAQTNERMGVRREGNCLQERLADKPEELIHAARSAALLPFGNSAKPALSHPAHGATRGRFRPPALLSCAGYTACADYPDRPMSGVRPGR